MNGIEERGVSAADAIVQLLTTLKTNDRASVKIKPPEFESWIGFALGGRQALEQLKALGVATVEPEFSGPHLEVTNFGHVTLQPATVNQKPALALSAMGLAGRVQGINIPLLSGLIPPLTLDQLQMTFINGPLKDLRIHPGSVAASPEFIGPISIPDTIEYYYGEHKLWSEMRRLIKDQFRANGIKVRGVFGEIEDSGIVTIEMTKDIG